MKEMKYYRKGEYLREDELETIFEDYTKEGKDKLKLTDIKEIVHQVYKQEMSELSKENKKRFNVTKEQGGRYITLFLNVLKYLVEKGNKVQLRNFIEIERKLYEKRKVYSRIKGDTVDVPKRYILKVTPSKEWVRRSRINIIEEKDDENG